jgi:iron complex transport system substrate-binding protein
MRIVSLLPSATEILFGLGAGDQVVGVTHECDFPEQAKTLPQLTSSALPQAGTPSEIDRHVRKSLHEGSSLYYLNSELLEDLAPDLIVTQELCAVCAVSYSIVDRAARRLSSDPRIVSLEPSSLEDVYANIETVGRLTDRESEAQELVASLQTRIDALKARVAGLPQQRVLVLEWTEPPMSGGHWAPQLVEIAGGIPVLGNPGANSQVLTWEQIAEADPDVIIVAPCGFDLEKTQEAVARLRSAGEWNALRAVRSGNVALVDGNAYLNRPGPRLVDTAEIFAGILHPVTK